MEQSRKGEQEPQSGTRMGTKWKQGRTREQEPQSVCQEWVACLEAISSLLLQLSGCGQEGPKDRLEMVSRQAT